MSKISQEVIEDWVANKQRIQDRLNRIEKRLKKYSKQKKHFELRLRLIKQHEAEKKDKAADQKQVSE